MAGIQNLMRFLPRMQGSSAKVTLGAKQLQEIASKNKQAQKAVEKILTKCENPSLEVAYKAKANYSIAGLRLRDGKNVVGTGAVSITNPGSSQAVVKYRLNNSTIKANGFIDGGKVARTDDAAVSIARKGGNVKADVQVGDAMAHHVQANECEVIDLAKTLGANKFLENYVRGTQNLQRGADAFMTDIRKLFRGESLSKPFKAEKVAVGVKVPEMRFKAAPIPPEEITKMANIDKILSKAKQKGFTKETMGKLYAEIKNAPQLGEKKLNTAEIQDLISKFKTQA